MLKVNVAAMAVWGAAFIAAGAFAYTISSGSPRVAEGRTTSLSNQLVAPAPATVPVAVDGLGTFITLPQIVITGRRHLRPMLLPPLVRAQVSSEQVCSGWRSLEQGNGSQLVRSCE